MFRRKAVKKPAHVVLTVLDDAMAHLTAARAEYAHAEHDRLPIDAVRAAYDGVSAAYRDAVVASTSARRLRGPKMDQQLRELLSQEQEHLLNAPSGVPQIMTARPVSRTALGPDIAGMVYDPTPPGDHATHLFGANDPVS